MKGGGCSQGCAKGPRSQGEARPCPREVHDGQGRRKRRTNMAVNYFFKLELYRVEEGRQGEENLRSVLRATCIPVPFSVEASTDPAHPIRGEREKREVREA